MRCVMLKKLIVLLLVVSVLPAAVPAKEGHKFGIGIAVGNPTGVDFKFWFNRRRAFDLALQWKSDVQTYFHINYLFHDYKFVPKKGLSGDVPVYYGAGIHVLDAANVPAETGIRLVMGIDYLFDEMPVDIYAEIVPTVIIQPNAGGMLAVCMGARYYFE